MEKTQPATRSRKKDRGPAQIYIGNLSWHTKLRDLERVFRKFGQVLEIKLVPRIGFTFAVIEFSDRRSARIAVFEKDGCLLLGKPIRVELLPRKRKSASPSPPPPMKGVKRISANPTPPPPLMKEDTPRIFVSGLPLRTRWQDLKDHVRDLVKINDCRANVFPNGEGAVLGVVEFRSNEVLQKALKTLDGSRFRNDMGFSGIINVGLELDWSESARSAEGRSRSRSKSGSLHSHHQHHRRRRRASLKSTDEILNTTQAKTEEGAKQDSPAAKMSKRN